MVAKCIRLLMVVVLFSTSLLADAAEINVALQQKLASFEKTSGTKIGAVAINTATNTYLQYRATQRFPLCSTFKVMVTAAILQKSMTERDFLQQRIFYKKQDFVYYSPVTEKHLADGMTVAELSAAAMTMSDNTATNLLLKNLGGPQAVTAFARSIGDKAFRNDRFEPDMSSSVPGDVRDTSTPLAMANSLQRLVLGDSLGLIQRQQLQTWLIGNTTGDKLIRASVPKGWTVGDKSGAGDYGTRNDIAIIWPLDGAPIVMAIYTTQSKKDAESRDAVVAGVARILLDELTQVKSGIKTANK